MIRERRVRAVLCLPSARARAAVFAVMSLTPLSTDLPTCKLLETEGGTGIFKVQKSSVCFSSMSEYSP